MVNRDLQGIKGIIQSPFPISKILLGHHRSLRVKGDNHLSILYVSVITDLQKVNEDKLISILYILDITDLEGRKRAINFQLRLFQIYLDIIDFREQPRVKQFQFYISWSSQTFRDNRDNQIFISLWSSTFKWFKGAIKFRFQKSWSSLPFKEFRRTIKFFRMYLGQTFRGFKGTKTF